MLINFDFLSVSLQENHQSYVCHCSRFPISLAFHADDQWNVKQMNAKNQNIQTEIVEQSIDIYNNWWCTFAWNHHKIAYLKFMLFIKLKEIMISYFKSQWNEHNWLHSHIDYTPTHPTARSHRVNEWINCCYNIRFYLV